MTTYSKMIARLKPPQSATLDTFTVSLLSCPSSMVSLVVFYAKTSCSYPFGNRFLKTPTWPSDYFRRRRVTRCRLARLASRPRARGSDSGWAAARRIAYVDWQRALTCFDTLLSVSVCGVNRGDGRVFTGRRRRWPPRRNQVSAWRELSTFRSPKPQNPKTP